MKKNKKSGTQPVRVPALDPAILNGDLLKAVVAEGSNFGWAYAQIEAFINRSFPMGHNPLETLRKLLPKWRWSVYEVDWQTNEELEAAVYCSYASYCHEAAPAGKLGRELVIIQWVYSNSSAVEANRVFHITATRPVAELGFAVKTAGKPGKYEPQWVFVNFATPIGVENGWNIQPYPAGNICEGTSQTFRHFAGLIPDGTRPVPVEQIGESRRWDEGSPWGSGEWGKSGYAMDYRMPDGVVVTQSVTTDEWP